MQMLHKDQKKKDFLQFNLRSSVTIKHGVQGRTTALPKSFKITRYKNKKQKQNLRTILI